MSSLLRAVLSSSMGTGLSRFLGLLREQALLGTLGAGAHADAWHTAWKVPGVIRRFVADEGLTGALIPGLARAEDDDGPDEARHFAGRVLTVLTMVSVFVSAAVIAGAPWVVELFAAGFLTDPVKFELTVQLTRIMVPLVIWVSLVSWVEGLLNHKGHFFVPKLAPGLISAAIVLACVWPGSDDPFDIAIKVSWAAVVGGLVHLAVCLPPLVKHWGVIRPRLDGLSDPRFVAMMHEMGKVAVIGILAQINIIVLNYVASFLENGSVTLYDTAIRVVDIAQGMIAVGIGSAMLPALSRAVSEARWPDFERAFGGSVRLAAALLLPVAGHLSVLAHPTIVVLFQRGEFTAFHATQTASALQVLTPYMLGLASIQILKKPFFALDRRNELMVVGGLGVLLTGGLGMSWGEQNGLVGLCGALSVSTVLQAAAYLVLLRRKAGAHLGLRELVPALGRIAVASLPAMGVGMGIAELGSWEQGCTLWNVGVLSAAMLAGGATYTGAAMLLGVEEIRAMVDRVGRRRGR